MNTFVDTFNAEYSASVDNELAMLNVNVNAGPGLRINNPGFWSVVKKSSYYRLPGEIIEFMNVFADASANGSEIPKLHANALKVVTPRQCVISKIDSLRCVNYRMSDPYLVNLADWAVFMIEHSTHRKFYVYCVNCNPVDPRYGNIMLIRDDGGFVDINIPYTSIGALIQDLMGWFVNPAPSVTVDRIDRYMDSVCRRWICKILGREITVREALTTNNIPGLFGDIMDHIKEHLQMEMFTFVDISMNTPDITSSSFSLYVINDQW